MEIHTGLDSLPVPDLKGSVATWGVFDGVHRGHVRVLNSLVGWARSRNVPSLVITFDRHPAQVLRGNDVPLVTSTDQRLRLIGRSGVNHLLLLSFTPEFAEMSAEEFVGGVLVNRIGVSGILLGYDSQFGKGRAGDIRVLKQLGAQFDIEVCEAEPMLHRGRPISSSLIREMVREGRLEEARDLLGRPLTLSGRASRGRMRGAALGFATANLAVHHRVHPPNGVYAVEADVEGRIYLGVANLGVRPTFESGARPLLEVHLLDYPGGDLYGAEMEVRFLFRVREERKFAGPEELKKQIEADIRMVRERVRG